MKLLCRAFFSCFFLLFFTLLAGCSKNTKIEPDEIPEPSANPDWVIMDTAGGEDYDSGEEIAIDAAGNVYVVGNIAATAKFGSITKQVEGENSCFVTKYNRSGVLEWVQTIGGVESAGATGIAVDSKNNVYVLGRFNGLTRFGNITKTSVGGTESFLAKFDTNGNILWVQTIAGKVLPEAIATDKNDNPYICGYFLETVNFGGISKTSGLGESGSVVQDIFIVKYNAAGVFQKVETAGGKGEEFAKGISVDEKGNIYLTGYFQGTINFQGISKTVQDYRSINLYVAKYNADFEIQWVQMAQGPYMVLGRSIEVDKNENVYVSGAVNGTVKFGTIVKQAEGEDPFVAKLDKNGNFQWVQTIIGSYLNAEDLSLDGKGNVYLTGDFSRETTFGTISKTSAGSYDIFVAKYDPSGNTQWVKTVGGRFSDSGKGIASDVKGNIYVTGHFGETVNFGTTSKTSAGAWDVFTAKIQ